MATRRSVLAAGLAAAGVFATAGPAAAATGHKHCPQPTAAATAVAYVQAQLGKPYQFGATGPNAFDASGLVVAAYASAGVTLTHSTAGLLEETTPVDALQPGDLVFYGTDSATTVAVAIGGDQVVGVFHAGSTVHIEQTDFQTVFSYGRVAG